MLIIYRYNNRTDRFFLTVTMGEQRSLFFSIFSLINLILYDCQHNLKIGDRITPTRLARLPVVQQLDVHPRLQPR
jgi:hypothetical protein